MIRIKLLNHARCGSSYESFSPIEWEDCLFIRDAACRDYDWLLVYDDLPRVDVGTVCHECEPLRCPPEQTILVTAEPPSIKIYPRPYTRQFGYVLTTHDRCFLPHRNYTLGRGCLYWMAGYPMEEVLAQPVYMKTKSISTVCSGKRMKRTMHYKRFELISQLAKNLPELDWYGEGVNVIQKKYDALNSYRYHIAMENYIHPHHWTDKISDPILGLCLTFYAGDPALGEILPPESFIPIPYDSPKDALQIIKYAINNNEYEKRFTAIREARRLIIAKYNIYAQCCALIHAHTGHSVKAESSGANCLMLKGRHQIRKNPLYALEEAVELVRFRWAALIND